MKSLFLFLSSLIATCAMAAAPDVVLDFKNAYNGYGTFAGHLASKPVSPVAVSVSNGGLKYSTVVDKDGNWAITFRLLTVQSDISAWELSNPADVSTPLRLSPE